MTTNYMHVTDLNADELNELKGDLFYGNVETCFLPKEKLEIIENAICPEDIPDELVIDVYKDFDFIKDDFFCNQ